MTTPELFSFEKTFTQEADCCSNFDQDIVIGQDDGGAGAYWWIKTERWAFSSIEEVVELLERAGVRQYRSPPVGVATNAIVERDAGE